MLDYIKAEASSRGLGFGEMFFDGNSFHAGVIAWLLAHALLTAGIIPRLPTTDEIADPQLCMNLFDTSGPEHDPFAASFVWGDPLASQLALTRYYLKAVSSRDQH